MQVAEGAQVELDASAIVPSQAHLGLAATDRTLHEPANVVRLEEALEHRRHRLVERSIGPYGVGHARRLPARALRESEHQLQQMALATPVLADEDVDARAEVDRDLLEDGEPPQLHPGQLHDLTSSPASRMTRRDSARKPASRLTTGESSRRLAAQAHGW